MSFRRLRLPAAHHSSIVSRYERSVPPQKTVTKKRASLKTGAGERERQDDDGIWFRAECRGARTRTARGVHAHAPSFPSFPASAAADLAVADCNLQRRQISLSLQDRTDCTFFIREAISPQQAAAATSN